MKKIILSILAAILIAGCFSCEEKIDIEKEKAAIMAVIQAESEAARVGDYEGLISCYIQDEYNTRVGFNQTGYKVTTGWEQLDAIFKNYDVERTEEELNTWTVSKENPMIKLMDETAWVICDNVWEGSDEEGALRYEGLQITFLEKVDGEWKFSFAAWLSKPEPDDDDDDAHEDEEDDDDDDDDKDEG
ncbi:hypothetical protein ACFLTU_08615 [Bacteroidota bacterium]